MYNTENDSFSHPRVYILYKIVKNFMRYKNLLKLLPHYGKLRTHYKELLVHYKKSWGSKYNFM